MKLSIIIPYYNTLELTQDLLLQLQKQIDRKDIEIIVVDDGCNEYNLEVKYGYTVHLEKNSGTASVPRNIGIELARGEYITFIDSDDTVSDDYISKILKAIEGKPDIVFLSWQSKIQKVIMNTQPPKWNCAVWCRVYKRETIGDVRFDDKLRIAEDLKFNEQIKFKTKACIKDIIYYYNNGRKGSLINGDN